MNEVQEMDEEKHRILAEQLEEQAKEVKKEDMEYAQKKGAEKLEKLKNDIPKALTDLWGDLCTLWRMLSCYAKGEYKEVPVSSIASIVVALLYFISPIDLIPDFIPVAGYLDDAAMIGLCLKMIGGDIEAFQKWESERKD